jgi:hypothetical protein
VGPTAWKKRRSPVSASSSTSEAGLGIVEHQRAARGARYVGRRLQDGGHQLVEIVDAVHGAVDVDEGAQLPVAALQPGDEAGIGHQQLDVLGDGFQQLLVVGRERLAVDAVEHLDGAFYLSRHRTQSRDRAQTCGMVRAGPEQRGAQHVARVEAGGGVGPRAEALVAARRRDVGAAMVFAHPARDALAAPQADAVEQAGRAFRRGVEHQLVGARIHQHQGGRRGVEGSAQVL